MAAPPPSPADLAAQVARLQAEVADLRAQLQAARGAGATADEANAPPPPAPSSPPPPTVWERDPGLSLDQVERYSRQMLLPWFGTKG